ncbi:MAG: ATP synthase F0 subunit B [Candidatus Gracilibacteria bacterium]|nr:ATP synthase F0 subunit B [Candidatus Gracilibacteria bacterium]
MDVLAKLGIDIMSVVIYLVNFGILLALMAYFITGPVLRIIDKRRDQIKGNIEEAERLKKEFMEEKLKSDKEKAALKSEMEQQLADLKKELEERRKKQDEALDAKKAKMLSDVREVVEAEKQGILKAAEKQTLALIEKVVMHVVSNKVPEKVVQESVSDAWKSYKS